MNNLGIFRSVKLRNIMVKKPSKISKAKFHSEYFGLLPGQYCNDTFRLTL